MMGRRRRRRGSSLSGRDLRAIFGIALFFAAIYVLIEYWFIFLIIGIGLLLIKYSKESKSSSRTYISNADSAVGKGAVGEAVVSEVLSKYAIATGSELFNDIIIGEYGKSAQIDHLLVTTNAIFFIETKRYSGGVFGDDTKDTWYQVIFKKTDKGSKKVKNSFLNPFLQNAYHIKCFEREIEIIDLPPLINIVCFVINEDMTKELEIINRTKGYYLTTNDTLNNTIKLINEELNPVKTSTLAISERKDSYDSIISKLNEIIVTDENERQNHIRRLKLKEVELLEELIN